MQFAGAAGTLATGRQALVLVPTRIVITAAESSLDERGTEILHLQLILVAWYLAQRAAA